MWDVTLLRVMAIPAGCYWALGSLALNVGWLGSPFLVLHVYIVDVGPFSVQFLELRMILTSLFFTLAPFHIAFAASVEGSDRV